MRKGAVGQLSLVSESEPGTWYMFSNRTRGLIKCVRTDGTGYWMAYRRIGEEVTDILDNDSVWYLVQIKALYANEREIKNRNSIRLTIETSIAAL